MTTRVAVTGANGFIGRHLVRELATRGYCVTSVARQADGPIGAVAHVVGDVCDEATWVEVGGADIIVHLAALSDASLSFDRPVEYNVSNAIGTLRGLEAARRWKAKFVLASTQRAYRSNVAPVSEDHPLAPVDPYGYSKLIAEKWVAMYQRLYALPGTIVRFFSVYGPGQMARGGTSGVVALFATRALRGEGLVVHGKAWRDFSYVDDVVAGVKLVLESPVAMGQTFNIATGEATSTEDLARQVVAVIGSAATIRVEDGEILGESYVANIDKARTMLNYRPEVRLREGLERYVEWLRGRL